MLVALCVLVAAIVSAVMLIDSSIGPLKKTFIVMALFVPASAIYFSFNSYMGWAAHTRIPDGSMLLQVVIYEPKAKNDGHIIVLAQGDVADEPGIFDYVPFAGAPRLYEVPYDPEVAKQFDKARQAIADGNIVTMHDGKMGDGMGVAEARDGQAGDGDQGGAELDYMDRDDQTMKILNPAEVLRKNDP